MPSQVYLHPPEGFVESERFRGWEQPSSGATISVIDLPFSFEEGLRSFSPDQCASQQMLLLEKHDLSHQGKSRALVRVIQDCLGDEVEKWIALLGDAHECSMVIGAARVGVPDTTRKRVCQAICSAEIRPLVEKPTGIRLTQTGVGNFQVLSQTADYTVWTPHGQPLEVFSEGPFFTLVRIHELVELSDLVEYSTLHLVGLANTCGHSVDEVGELTIDGLYGIEMTANAMHAHSSTELFIYQVALCDRHLSHMMVGLARASHRDEHLPSFRKMARCFRLLRKRYNAASDGPQPDTTSRYSAD